MKEYNVKQISEILDTNPETVRRWIRSGKLDAKLSSKKGGNVITEEALLKFAKEMPKYSGLIGSIFAATALPVVGLPLIMGTLVGGFATGLLSKKESKMTERAIREFLNNEIDKLSKSAKKKKDTIVQLQSEVEMDEARIKEYLYALDNYDLKKIADDINSKYK